MLVSEILHNMLLRPDLSMHDINHLLKVYAYTSCLAQAESLSQRDQNAAKIAAIVHDIACPLCRQKFGKAIWTQQEYYGGLLVRQFFVETDIDQDLLEDIVYMVEHHHTLTAVNSLPFQILVEADFLVNADEHPYSQAQCQVAENAVFKTVTGKALLHGIYLRNTNPKSSNTL